MHILLLFYSRSKLTHWGRVTDICVSKLGLHWLIACRQDIIVNWTLGNKPQWNFNGNLYVSIQKNALEMTSAKWRWFCLGLHVLKDISRRLQIAWYRTIEWHRSQKHCDVWIHNRRILDVYVFLASNISDELAIYCLKNIKRLLLHMCDITDDKVVYTSKVFIVIQFKNS